LPVVADSFDATGAFLSFPVGRIDWFYRGRQGADTRSAFHPPVVNTETAGSFTFDGSLYTLTLPFSGAPMGTGTFRVSESPITPVRPVFSGLLVATAVVPEPQTLVLAALALATLVAHLCRTRRAPKTGLFKTTPTS
jgi:hypothetical protein